ncbi:MAG: hypothetical protein ABIG71_00300 [Candidatus Uhrbacteria bacterium]
MHRPNISRAIPCAAVALVAMPRIAYAHCPLCTAGAGVAAILAAKLGVSAMSIGVFIGAFALAIGLWAARALERWRIPLRRTVLGVGSFVLTVFPLRSLLYERGSTFVSIAGEYGSLLNRTYVYDRFLVGAVIGAVILVSGPWLSTKLTNMRRGKMLPFQGMTLTFVVIFLVALIVEFV